MAQIDKRVLDFYSENPEIDRLEKGWFILERLRTEQLLLKHLPPPPGQVLDIGGGAGAYAFFLADKGYSVHLIDPVPVHIKQAAEREHSRKNKLASLNIGAAGKLHQPDDCMDAVLMFGPLYHLVEEKDRLQALHEAFRVLKKGGLFLGVGISRYSSYLDGFVGKFLLDPDYQEIVERDIKSGKHLNHTAKDYFTTSYFHHPTDFRQEIKQAGFSEVKIIAIEGPGWAYPDLEDLLLQNRKAGQKILEFIELMESDESIIGASAHFMGLGTK